FDLAGRFGVCAPGRAGGGWRGVAWDRGGPGDSEHAALYSGGADVRDATVIIDSISPDEPIAVLGHSKGGGIMLQLADALPHRVSMLVNIDGLPSKRSWPDVADHERTRLLAEELSGWLEHRHRSATGQRKPGT